MRIRLGAASGIIFAAWLVAALSSAQAPPPEGVRVRELGPIGPHWVFLVSPAGADSELSTKIEIVDGDSLQLLGLLTGGLLSTAALSPDRKFIYMADTFYSRGSRGDRTDVISIYDARRLAPVH